VSVVQFAASEGFAPANSNPGLTICAETRPATNTNATAHTALPMNLPIPFIIATLTFRLCLFFPYPTQRLTSADTFISLQIVCDFYWAGSIRIGRTHIMHFGK
jgi:hypothetical protein